MKLGKIALLACMLVGLEGMELHAQATPPEQPASPGAPTSSSEPTSPPGDQPKQPAGEPAKPGQGATADQTPSPLPAANLPQAPGNSANGTTPTPPEKSPATKPKKKKAATPSKPRKRVIRDGGAEEVDPQISEGMPNEVAVHRRASTDTLLTSTEANLKRISSRTLTAEQQSTVNQIRLFMQESRDAIQKSDVDRAHTLALKAHLLSNSLLKQ